MLLIFIIKYPWIVPLKQKSIAITNSFQQILDESGCKLNKICVVYLGSKFYNRSMKSLLQDNNVEMYFLYNERKTVVAERFIGNLKNKTYKYMTRVSKNIYIDKLDDIVNKYNNTYHSSIKTKPVDVKSNTYSDFGRK